MSQAQQAQLDPHKKLWANNIRDVSYDIDDIVDDLLVRKDSEGTDDAKSGKTTRCKTIARLNQTYQSHNQGLQGRQFGG